MRVYQDVLLDTTPESVKRIIAETHTQNYAALRWLQEKGATIMGTEGSALLEEYHSLQAIVIATDEESRRDALLNYHLKKDQLLEERDLYMVARINSTLHEGEVGLLFRGAEHNITRYLDQDIRCCTPETLEGSLLEIVSEVERGLKGPAYIGKERV